MSGTLLTIAALLVSGWLLLAIELFVLPGFGVVGIAGLLFLAAGAGVALARLGSAAGGATVALVLAGTTALLVWLPRTRAGRALVHRGSLAGAHAHGASGVSIAAGQAGVAESDLRPAGIARFGEARESVVTDGEFVRAGTAVRVVAVDGARIVVEAAPPAV